MKRLLLIYNPMSGKGRIKTELSDIVDIFVKGGYEVTIYSTQNRRDAQNKARANAEGYDRIVVCGGDGTLDEVVTGIMESGVSRALGYIPMGSTNDFAKSIGIPSEQPRQAAHTAISSNIFACDIGSFNADYFVYVAAFGLFTEVSYQTSQEMKNMIGHAAYILEAVKQLSEIPTYRMQFEHDGKIIHDEFIYGMITNTTSVGGFEGIIPGNIALDDGVFEVTLIRTPKNPIDLSEILGYLTGFNKDTNLVYSFQADRIRLQAAKEVPWTLDGEFGGNHKRVRIRNLKKALKLAVR